MMERNKYPALVRNPSVVFLDASAAFPIHDDVREAVDASMAAFAGSPDKGAYLWSRDASQVVRDTRAEAASFIGCQPDRLSFSHSASSALDIILRNLLRRHAIETVAYSDEDHTSITGIVPASNLTVKKMTYRIDGTLEIPDDIMDASGLVFVISHMHHLYGSLNDIAIIRRRFPESIIILDASQSVSRTQIDVEELGCDVLLFSSQKIGGIGGIGVVYIADTKHKFENLEPHTLPVQAAAACGAAIRVLHQRDVKDLSFYLDTLTTYFIMQAGDAVPGIVFSKGPAHSNYSCRGNGIVSFKLEGYASADVAMILGDKDIFVRAADHCVDDTVVDRDVVRVSMHAYTTRNDIDKLVSALAKL